MYFVSRKFNIAIGHCLSNSYTKACQNFHGHNYTVELVFKKLNLDNDMVIDFTKIKEIFDKHIKSEYDHKFLISAAKAEHMKNELKDLFCTDLAVDVFLHILKITGIVVVEFEPTAENLCKHFFNIINCTGLSSILYNVSVIETENNTASYPNF